VQAALCCPTRSLRARSEQYGKQSFAVRPRRHQRVAPCRLQHPAHFVRSAGPRTRARPPDAARAQVEVRNDTVTTAPVGRNAPAVPPCSPQRPPHPARLRPNPRRAAGRRISQALHRKPGNKTAYVALREHLDDHCNRVRARRPPPAARRPPPAARRPPPAARRPPPAVPPRETRALLASAPSVAASAGLRGEWQRRRKGALLSAPPP